MKLNLEALDGSSAPKSSDLMRNLIWAPGYQDADAWFSPVSAFAEGIVIHEISGWPTALVGLGFGEPMSVASDNTASANGAANQDQPFPRGFVRDLLDAKAGRLVRGYLTAGRSLPGAHVLCCALAADSNRRSGYYASAGDSMSIPEAATLRTPARRFWRQAASYGPFEFLVVIGFLFETFMAERLEYWERHPRAAWSTRPATLGRDVLHFILDQDPSNRLAVQFWLDQGTARCADLFRCADEVVFAAIPDSARNESARSRNPLSALSASFADLVPYGINPPGSPAMQSRSRARA
jgi:hypothetical protein